MAVDEGMWWNVDDVLPQVQGDDHQGSISVLEVPVPGFLELRSKSRNLSLGWTELARGIHRIPAQKLIILLDHLLNIESAVRKAIDRLARREASPIRVQCQVMILVLLPYIGKGLNKRNSCTLEDFGIAESRSLKNEWSPVRTGRNDHHLRGAHRADRMIGSLPPGVGLVLDPNGSLVVI